MIAVCLPRLDAEALCVRWMGQAGLYPVNGEASDWMHNELGILAYSPEVIKRLASAYLCTATALSIFTAFN